MSTSVPFRERYACPISDATAFSGLGRTRFYELLKTGEIASIKSGRRRLVLVESLIAWCEGVSHDEAAA